MKTRADIAVLIVAVVASGGLLAAVLGAAFGWPLIARWGGGLFALTGFAVFIGHGLAALWSWSRRR